MSRLAIALAATAFLAASAVPALGSDGAGVDDGGVRGGSDSISVSVRAIAVPPEKSAASFASIGVVPPRRARKVDVGTLRLREAALPDDDLTHEQRMEMRRKAALARIEALARAPRSRRVEPRERKRRKPRRGASASAGAQLRDGYDANGTYHPADPQERIERGLFQIDTSSGALTHRAILDTR